MFKSGSKILSYGHLKFKNALGEVMVYIDPEFLFYRFICHLLLKLAFRYLTCSIFIKTTFRKCFVGFSNSKIVGLIKLPF